MSRGKEYASRSRRRMKPLRSLNIRAFPTKVSPNRKRAKRRAQRVEQKIKRRINRNAYKG